MKKVFAAIVMFCVVVALAGVSYAWQGRMEGMGNPQGLIGDESDLLLHPAQITFGEGVRYYLDYKFTYTGLIHMDSDINLGIGSSNVPILGGNLTSGHTTEHDTLIGASFPLAKGRMGVFFGYDKQNGDMDSDVKILGYDFGLDSNATTRLDNYALKLIYGQPVGGMNLGAEFGVAYRNEKQDDGLNFATPVSFDDILSVTTQGIGTTMPYVIPYNSSYWELSGKLGLNKKFNQTDIDWTVYGAGLLSADSDNQYKLQGDISEIDVDDEPGNVENALGVRNNMNGDVSGYRLGSDLWIRHHVDECLSLPFLVSVGYTKKHRDGDGPINLYEVDDGEYDPFNPNVDLKYDDVLRTLNVKVGGGVTHEIKDCRKLGAGLYYNYIQSRDRLGFRGDYVGDSRRFEGDFVDLSLNEFPNHKEHRLTLNLAGEQVVCDDFSVRGGLNFFYGWIRSDDYGGSAIINLDGYGFTGAGSAALPLKGHTCGFEGSLGATKKLCGLTFEPFIKGGYRVFDTDGSTNFGPVSVGLDKQKDEWFTGAGLSVLFGK